MLATLWQGCYQDTWQDSIVPASFCHPAKFSRGLIHRIYRYLLAEGHIAEGMTALDPFGGVALGALDAMTYGLNWLGVELEPKFVSLGKKNLELWRQRYGFRQGTLVQGDSRQLRSILQGTGVQAVVGSPPYAEAISNGRSGIDKTKGVDPRKPDSQGVRRLEELAEGYGTTPGQLGAMPPGVVVSSPPWENSLADSQAGAAQIAGFKAAMARDGNGHAGRVTSPGAYGTSHEQLGNTAGDTFWSASAQIMQELAAILPAGAVCAWVVKSYVSKKAIVPFPDQWRGLCEQHGFVLVEEIHASLVEDHGTQHSLFGEAQRVTTEKKSFFRRLAEKKGSPRIDHETVLIVRKDGDGGGVCCVSSPPYAESDQNDTKALDSKKRLEAAGEPRSGCGIMRSKHGMTDGYGTTPGNLGNLPVGRP